MFLYLYEILKIGFGLFLCLTALLYVSMYLGMCMRYTETNTLNDCLFVYVLLNHSASLLKLLYSFVERDLVAFPSLI